MRTRLALLGPALLAGCGGFAVVPVPIPLGTFSTGPALEFVSYACADGRAVEVAYPSTETAILRRGGVPVELALAPSASGARYVGGGLEWWGKGTEEATLSPLGPGEAVASAPGVTCTTA